MTTLLAPTPAAAEGGSHTRSVAPWALDPFVVPDATTPVAGVRARARLILDVHVERVYQRDWMGGPALEVTVGDSTGSVLFVFLGRRSVAGLEPGRRLVAAGTAARQHGRLVILNPLVWLKAETGEH